MNPYETVIQEMNKGSVQFGVEEWGGYEISHVSWRLGW